MMQKSMQFKFLLAFLIFSGSILVWRYYGMNPAPVSVVKAEASQGTEFLSVPNGSTLQAASAVGKSPAEPAKPVHPLHLALANAKDLRVLLEKLKSQPESGGHYYASLINSRCSDAQEHLAEIRTMDSNVTHELASRRDVAVNKLRRQCEGFLRDELSVDQLSNFIKSKKDPLVSIQMQLFNAATRDQKKQALIALLDTQSPEMVSALVIRYYKDGLYFDGTSYAAGENGDAILLNSAVALAECQLGAICDANDFYVIKTCATEMICTDSKEEMLKQRIFKERKNPEADMDKIKLLTAKIVTAIQTRDVDKFIPK